MKKLLIAFFLGLGVLGFGQSGAGRVDISVTTLPNGAAFSPKHVLAIWVEDDAGNFVKTLKLNAATRKQYLYTWNNSSAGDITDATTGATLGTHLTHQISWDCTNTAGEVVADGTYVIQIEYTSEHAQGPKTSIVFDKSGVPVSLSPADESYFEHMQLEYTPPPSPTRAHEINQMLGRGVNLGNGFEAPRGESWGIQIQNKYLEIIAEHGFSHVRIPIRWNDYAGINPPYEIEPWFLDTIKKVVDAALDNKMLAMINMHHYDDFNDNPTSAHRVRFLAIWSQIAEAFQDYSDSLLFEFLNEPHELMSQTHWNLVFREALDTVRKTNPTRICVVGPPDWNNVNSVDKLDWPADTNMIMTVHYYNPFQFTHQGASWAGDNADTWLGTTWDSTTTQMNAVVNDFAKVRAFSEEKNVPVHVGEFGAYERAPKDSRSRWTAFCARTFESFGFSWAYWEFGSGFGVYDPANGIWKNFLLNALTETIDTNSIEPEPWEARNGGFTNELLGWNFQTGGTAVASAEEINGEAVFSISAVDETVWNVQFFQTGLKLIEGGEYRLTFDAWTSEGEVAALNAYFGNASDPYDYYNGAKFDISGIKTKQVFEFTMTHATSNNVRLVFDMGFVPAEIHLDNIVIEQLYIPTLVESIVLGPDPAEIVLKSGSLQLTAEILPDDANNKALVWEIEKGETLATLSTEGLVSSTGIADGDVRIKVSATDGSDVTATIFVALKNQLQVESIELNPTKNLIDTYQGSARIFFEVLPSSASNKTLLWEIIEGEDLAEITQDGFLYALGTGDGDVKVRASATDGSNLFSEVTIALENQVLIESVEISSAIQTIDVLEGSLQFSVAVLPENASRKMIVWSVEEGSSKATIDQTGLLKASGHGNGEVIVKAAANDGSGIFDLETVLLSNQGVDVKTSQSDELKVYINNRTICYMLQPGTNVKQVCLVDLSGRKLFTRELPAQESYGEIRLNDGSRGMFILLVQEGRDGNRMMRKIVID